VKKLWIILALLIAILILSGVAKAQSSQRFDFTIQAGYNVGMKVGSENSSYDMEQAFPTLFIETHFYPFEGLRNLGIGPGFGFYHLKTSDRGIGWLYDYPSEEEGLLYWWPVYLSVKYNFSTYSAVKPYLKMDHGYSFFDASGNMMIPNNYNYDTYYLYGGYYMSLSAGLAFARVMNLELNYSMLNSGLGCDYKSGYYSGYTYWEEMYKTNMVTLSLGLCL
jgi:hypothetical protein